MTRLVEVAPDHVCDRCSHPLKYHAGSEGNSVCMVVNGKVWHGVIPRGMRKQSCWCDGFVPRPA